MTTANGEREVVRAGHVLASSGQLPGVPHTSMQSRAIHTSGHQDHRLVQALWPGQRAVRRAWLRVESQPPGSELHIHVTIPDGHMPTSGDVAELREGLDETFDRLALQLPD